MDRTIPQVLRAVALVYESKGERLQKAFEEAQAVLLTKTGPIETAVEITPGLSPLSPRLRAPIEKIQAAAKAEKFEEALTLLRNLAASLGVAL